MQIRAFGAPSSSLPLAAGGAALANFEEQCHLSMKTLENIARTG